jgi:hypothetical protein
MEKKEMVKKGDEKLTCEEELLKEEIQKQYKKQMDLLEKQKREIEVCKLQYIPVKFILFFFLGETLSAKD